MGLYWINEFISDNEVRVQYRDGFSYRGYLIAYYRGFYNKKTKYYELYREDIVADNHKTKQKVKVSKSTMLIYPGTKKLT